MKISLCFLNILLTTFIMVIFISSALDKVLLYFFLFSFCFFYHFLLLNYKTPMDQTVSYYRYPKILVPASNRGCHDGRSPQMGSPKFNFFIFNARPMKVLKYLSIRKRKNLEKFGGTKMRVSPSNKATKI